VSLECEHFSAVVVVGNAGVLFTLGFGYWANDKHGHWNRQAETICSKGNYFKSIQDNLSNNAPCKQT
jgi:hypothetical protein